MRNTDENFHLQAHFSKNLCIFFQFGKIKYAREVQILNELEQSCGKYSLRIIKLQPRTWNTEIQAKIDIHADCRSLEQATNHQHQGYSEDKLTGVPPFSDRKFHCR